MFSNLKSDIGRWRKDPAAGFSKGDLYLFFEQGIWAVMVYRFGRWVRKIHVPMVSQVLKLIAFLSFKWIEMNTGISIPASAQIGKGLYIGHFSGIIVHSDARIGENCSLGPGVVIGTRGLGRQGVAVIGDNVYIGVGAKILGKINIGNNVKIAANAVVLIDVPDGSTVAGVPAKIIKKEQRA